MGEIMKSGLRMKIILITVAIILFAIGTNAVITTYSFSNEYSEALQSKTLVTGQTLKFQLEKVLSFGIPIQNLVGFEEQCKDLTNKYKEISYAMVVDLNGNILFHNDPSQMGKKLAGTKTLNAVKSEKETVQVYSENGKEYYDIFIPLFGTNAEHIGAVRIGLPIDIINRNVLQAMIYSAIVAGISFIVAVLLLFFALSTWVTKPLTQLIDTIREISGGSTGFERRVEIYSEDEIGELASAFNRMVEDLQKTTVSKNYVDDILRSMFDMLVVFTPDNTIQTVNQTTCDVLGYRAEELVGQPFDILLADENLNPKCAWIDELIDKGAINNTEKVFTTKNGRKIPVVFSASILRDKDGRIQGIVSVAHDITERKKAEKAIVEKEKEYRTILSTTMDGFWITDINGRFLDVNDAYCRLIGYSRAELLAMGIQDIEEKERPEETRQRITRIREVGFDRFETRHRCKDGRIVDVEVSVNYLGGDEGRLFVFLRDITERKRAETALLRFNEELEKGIRERTASLHRTSEQLKDEILQHEFAEKRLQESVDEKIVLLREIHHRVKNNLQIIGSLLNLQSRYIREEGTLRAIRESQTRVKAMALVHEKLYQSKDISKIDLGNYINSVGRSMFDFYDTRGKGISFRTDIQDIFVSINSAIPIGLIINELVSNSLKHAFPEGRRGEIAISIRKENNTLSIVYRDNGVGLPVDLDWRNTDSLGLKLVISLVEQMSGSIELDRTAGTTFTIILQEKTS
jgi:PAS domain S-box-containing protein